MSRHAPMDRPYRQPPDGVVGRRPRRSVRVRLMLLYAVPFVAVGAVLLLFPLLAVGDAHRVGAADGRPTMSPGIGLGPLLATLGVGLPLVAALALLLGWLIAGRFLRPLIAITSTARDISATNLDRRLALAPRDEFGELAGTLDELFDRLGASFDAQRHFVANAAHELRTPLTAERTLVQLALDDPATTADTFRATCRELLELNRRQGRLIDALLTLAMGEQGIDRAEPVDLADVAARAVRDRADDARDGGVEVGTDLSPAGLAGDRPLLASLVGNLIDNALRHNEAGGRIRVATSVEAGRAVLIVANTGPAIPPAELPRLFRPFERLDGNRVRRTGHGLGLAIVRAIADAHRATITPAARPDGGLHVTVAFPGTDAR